MSAMGMNPPAVAGANGTPSDAVSKPSRPAVLTPEGAAEFLKVTPEVIRAEAASGRLPGRLVGAEWRFSRRALLRWLDAAEPAPVGTLAEWIAANPRVWDEEAEREAEAEIAEMAAYRRSHGLANPEAAALDAAEAAEEAAKAAKVAS